MKRQTLIGLTLGIAVSAAAALLLNTSPLYGQDRDQAERDRQRQLDQRQQLLQQRQQQQQQVQAEVRPGNVVPLEVHANPITGPTPSEVMHRLEVDGIQLPNDTRLITPITTRLEIAGFTQPGNPHPRLRTGRYQIYTFTIGGALPMQDSVSQWFDSYRQGQQDRRAMSVIQFSPDLEETQRTNLFEVLPVGLTVDITTGTWRLELAAEQIGYR